MIYPAQPSTPIGRIRCSAGACEAKLADEHLGAFPTSDAAADAVWERFLEQSRVQHEQASHSVGSASGTSAERPDVQVCCCNERGGGLVFKWALPVGARSTRALTTGMLAPPVVNRWAELSPECAAEIERLRTNALDPQLTDAEHQDLLQQLEALVRKGETATLLLVRPGVRGGDGEVMKRWPFIIELKPRLTTRPAFGRPVRHLRLYYGEPLKPDDLLLALRLATKSDGHPGIAEQDADALRAQSRANSWVP